MFIITSYIPSISSYSQQVTHDSSTSCPLVWTSSASPASGSPPLLTPTCEFHAIRHASPACAWLTEHAQGVGAASTNVKAGQTAFPVRLEMIDAHYHMESHPRCLFPSARSKMRPNRLRGQLRKVLGLSSREFLLSNGRPTVLERLRPRLQGRRDCILILGHSYMVAQTDRGHEPHRHYTLWPSSHLYMCVNGTRRCVIIIIDISNGHRVAPDFDVTSSHTLAHTQLLTKIKTPDLDVFQPDIYSPLSGNVCIYVICRRYHCHMLSKLQISISYTHVESISYLKRLNLWVQLKQQRE